MQATAASYVISPTALAGLEPDPGARTRSPVGVLDAGSRRAARPRRRLAPRRRAQGRQADRDLRPRRRGPVRVAPPTASAFAEELSHAVAALVAKYHDDTAAGGRSHRIVVAIHPASRPRPRSTRAPRRQRPSSRRSPEMAHPFEVRGEQTVNATPEQVWEALVQRRRAWTAGGWARTSSSRGSAAPSGRRCPASRWTRRSRLGPAAPLRERPARRPTTAG